MMKKLFILIIMLMPIWAIGQNIEIVNTDSLLDIEVKGNDLVLTTKNKLCISNYVPKTHGSLSNSSIYYNNCFISLWNEYFNDCNELVNDTITQTGTVNCRLVPIKMDGKIVSYSQVPVDTIWNKCDCNDYKNYGNLVLTGMWWTIDTLTGTSGWMDCNIRTTNSYIVKNSEKTKIEYEIIRQKVCVVKKRKTSMDDFLNRWLEEKGYIKQN